MSRVDELHEKYLSLSRDHIIQWEALRNGFRYTDVIDEVSVSSRQGGLCFRLGGLILAVIMVGTLLLVSCSSAPSTLPTSGTAFETTKPYGSLIVGRPASGASSVDPQTDTATAFGQVGAFIIDTLTYIGGDKQLKPGVAERWEIAPDGMSHTFFIRKGIKFHDGSDLTGADVKFSIDRMLDPKAPHFNAPAWRQTVAGIELKDNYTVVVRMKVPQFELLKGELADSMAAVLPKRYIEEKGVDYFSKNPIGSGPWKFMRYDPGSLLELEAVESHWREVPKFKNLKVVAVSEEASKVAMLKTGELDMAEVTLDSVRSLQEAGVRVISYDGDFQYYAWLFWDKLNPQKYVLGDVRVRKALQLGINAQEVASSMFGGKARPFALIYLSSSAYFYDLSVLKPDPFDPEGAKRLLAEAGYPNGFSMKYWDVGGGGLLSQVGQAVVGYFRKIGVRADLSAIEYLALYSMRSPVLKPDMFDTGYTYGSGAQRGFDGLPTCCHSTKSAQKTVNVPKLDELIEKVPLTLDPVEKKRLALEAAVLAQQQYSGLRIVSVETNVAVSAKVGEIAALSSSPLAYETIFPPSRR